MNNKGFNWFFPIAIAVILFLFLQPMMSNTEGQKIDEEQFYQLVQEGKVQEVMVYKDTDKADVYLTKEAKTATVQKTENDSMPFNAFQFTPTADYSLTFGDLKYFQERYNEIKKANPNIKTKMEFGLGKNPISELLFSVLIWVAVLGLFYFFLFRRMGAGGGGPGGQIFSIGKSLSLIHI